MTAKKATTGWTESPFKFLIQAKNMYSKTQADP